MNTRFKLVCVAALALAGTACVDKPQAQLTDVALPVATPDLVLMDGVTDFQDGSNGGHPDFLWLPPVVGEGVTPPGPLASGLTPIVEICSKYPDGPCSRNTPIEEDDHYHFGLKNGIEEKPMSGSPYTIRVLGVEGYLLGSFVVTLSSNRNIPLKFWLGEGFSQEEAQGCIDDDRCDLTTVPAENTADVIVTTTVGGDPSAPIAAAVFPPNWSPGDIDRTVIIDCRDTFPSEVADDGTGPLNTDLTQLPWYCDFSLDPPLAPGETFLKPVTVEVCETVTDEHVEAVLGKSSGDTDFELLLPRLEPTVALSCAIDYPGAPEIGAAPAFWNRVTRKLAAVFRVVGPEPLRATMRRDGGAGGSVEGFSRINPVIPRKVVGTLTDAFGASVSGVMVTLSDGQTADTTTETGPNGAYAFFPPAEGSYTVTVDTNDPDFPQFESLVANTSVVEVAGSGEYVADFQSNSLFVLVSGSANLAQATQACVQDHSGQLASIHSQAEDDYISRLVDPTGAGNITSWIGGIPNTNSGLFDASSSGTYAWIDGTDWDYQNWRITTGEPNGSGPAPAGVQFWPNTNGNLSGWNDVPSTAVFGRYVCSVPAS